MILAGAKSFYDNPLLFTGQRFDPESGLHHYKRRSYSSALGRFLERDPAWASDVRRRQNTGITAAATSPEVREQTNLYAYALDNPTNRTDPLGESSAAVGFRGEKQEQDDDGNPVTRYLVDFYIYDPCCEAVNLIQTVRYRAARGGSYTEWDVDDGRVGGLSNKSKNAPFYNETNQTANFVHKNITDKQGQTHTLDMPTSTMRDRPGSVLGRVWEFEVCAMCVAGRNAGLVYICSRWRAETAWYGTDKYVSVGEPGGPSDDWKKAAGAALAASDKGVKLK
ncbi:MAG: RHS repeat-associated core domain-containing protein [Acidobacteria bacterium]|nr:RHS repeat-associated core domain-containing protein [Acidobacteriota bacterium]